MFAISVMSKAFRVCYLRTFYPLFLVSKERYVSQMETEMKYLRQTKDDVERACRRAEAAYSNQNMELLNLRRLLKQNSIALADDKGW